MIPFAALAYMGLAHLHGAAVMPSSSFIPLYPASHH